MTQLFFLAPAPFVVSNALSALLVAPSQLHTWQDVGAVQVIGVIEMTDRCNTEAIAEELEAEGITVLPDHRFGGNPQQSAVTALKQYGVNASDTTQTAMAKIMAVSGFNPHKPKRFS